jgi:hypothetical protein
VRPEINALEAVRALLPHLPGWELDANTLRAIRENDSSLRHWVGLVNPAHPGADLSVNTSQQEGRLIFRARYPRDWEPWIDGGPGTIGGRRHSESITVSASKTPEQIARDVQRRLFDATGYLTRLADCMARKAESEKRQADGESLARELAALVGAQTTADKHKDTRGCSHLQTDENRRSFEVHTTDYAKQIECKVARGGTSVDLKLDNLTPAEAADILTMWHARHKQEA